MIHDTTEVRRDPRFQPAGGYGGECLGVYYPRLLRDGWILKDRLHEGRSNAWTIFEKQLPKGWLLRKYAHEQTGSPPGKGCYWDEHELQPPKDGPTISRPQWEWAEQDGKSLVWAEGGCLFRAPIHAQKIGTPVLLHDFNAMRFEAREAPY